MYNLEVTEQSESEEEIVEKKYSVVKKPNRRLVRVDHNEVIKAIEESKRKFFENTLCIYCGFNGSNSRALTIHVSRLHKSVSYLLILHSTLFFVILFAEMLKIVGVHIVIVNLLILKIT